jgi:hypothetical protein
MDTKLRTYAELLKNTLFDTRLIDPSSVGSWRKKKGKELWLTGHCLLLYAGRENFLAAEADVAICRMVANLSETRVLSALLACATHKSGYVRQKVAAHLDGAVEMAGSRYGDMRLLHRPLSYHIHCSPLSLLNQRVN